MASTHSTSSVRVIDKAASYFTGEAWDILKSSTRVVALDSSELVKPLSIDSGKSGHTGTAWSALLDAISPQSLYPHFYDKDVADESNGAPLVMEQLRQGIEDVQAALDAYQDADMPALWAALGLVASGLNKAHRYTQFNEALGSVISYVAQAVETADYSAITRESLMALQGCLRQVKNHPTMSLADAGDLVDRLESHGWDGNDKDVTEFMSNLLAYFDLKDVESSTTQSNEDPQGILS